MSAAGPQGELDAGGGTEVAARRGGQGDGMDTNTLLALRSDDTAALLLIALRGDF